MDVALRRSLYLEHVEESAMLYERRTQCLEDPESTLEDIAEHDERMDAHLDGLVLGQDVALEVCFEALESAEAGVAHCVSRVLSRAGKLSELARVSEILALEDDEQQARKAAVGAALGLEFGPACVSSLAELLEDEQLAPLVAHAIGTRRVAEGGPLLRGLLHRREQDTELEAVWALGELRDYGSLTALQHRFGHASEPRLWSALALACLKLGDPQIEGLLRSGAGISAWSPLGQLLSFDVPLSWLLGQLERTPSAELLVALALKGDPGCFAALLELLDEPRLGALAAGGLFAITGAPMLDAVEEPGPIEGEEPAEGEPDSLEAGWVGLSRDPALWRGWLSAEGQSWVVGQRYRLGEAIQPSTTVRAALCCALPLAIRDALFDELAICHGKDLRTRPDGLARAQLSALAFAAAPSLVLER